MAKHMLDGKPYDLNLDETTYFEELISDETIRQASINRGLRDILLSETDWMIIKAQETGGSISVELAAYRQALRDITAHANWPNLQEADWPTKP